MKAYNTKDVEYEDLVQSTKLYYNGQSVNRVTIMKYFQEGIWEGTLEDYKENKGKNNFFDGGPRNVIDIN